MKQEPQCDPVAHMTNEVSLGLAGIRSTRPQTMNESTELALRMQADIEMAEHVEAMQQEYETSPGQGLMNEDERLATWYVGKDKQADDMIQTIKNQSAMMIRQIEARRRGMIYAFGARVRATIDRMLQSQGKNKKSVNLLTGRAGYRKQSAKLQIVDAPAILAWAKVNCLDAIKESVSMTGINDYFERTGEVPPGVKRIEERENFYPDASVYTLEAADRPELPEPPIF